MLTARVFYIVFLVLLSLITIPILLLTGLVVFMEYGLLFVIVLAFVVFIGKQSNA